MSIYLIHLILGCLVLLLCLGCWVTTSSSVKEHFSPDLDEFQSPKSSLKNYNETTVVQPQMTQLQPHNSSQIDLYQPLPLWVYPYTYVNRHFDQILTTLVHQIEKDYNGNTRLNDRNNEEWRSPMKHPSKRLNWSNPEDTRIKSYVIDVLLEINRRFNMDVPIVGVRKDSVRYFWVNDQTVSIQMIVYKTYTPDDIKYFDGMDPKINDHLKMSFDREVVVYLDHIDPQKSGDRYHLKYLRFPQIDYENDDTWDDLRYAEELDHWFYLSRSKNPLYRMLKNTEARDLYVQKISKSQDSDFSCFSSQNTHDQINNQTDCEKTHGQWVQKCHQDTDCPYYQKNTPQPHGGCDVQTGYCQMPSGVTPLTYRSPANPENALCENCQKGFLGKNSIGSCCQEQGQNPNYLFPKKQNILDVKSL